MHIAKHFFRMNLAIKTLLACTKFFVLAIVFFFFRDWTKRFEARDSK